MNHTRLSPVTNDFNTSSRFGASSVARLEIPVRLPPGRARLSTTRVATGSPTRVKTIGMLCVAVFAASVAGSLLVKIKSTPAFASSSAAAAVAPGTANALWSP